MLGIELIIKIPHCSFTVKSDGRIPLNVSTLCIHQSVPHSPARFHYVNHSPEHPILFLHRHWPSSPLTPHSRGLLCVEPLHPGQ